MDGAAADGELRGVRDRQRAPALQGGVELDDGPAQRRQRHAQPPPLLAVLSERVPAARHAQRSPVAHGAPARHSGEGARPRPAEQPAALVARRGGLARAQEPAGRAREGGELGPRPPRWPDEGVASPRSRSVEPQPSVAKEAMSERPVRVREGTGEHVDVGWLGERVAELEVSGRPRTLRRREELALTDYDGAPGRT